MLWSLFYYWCCVPVLSVFPLALIFWWGTKAERRSIWCLRPYLIFWTFNKCLVSCLILFSLQKAYKLIMFESICQDQFLGTFQVCQRKIHCLISLCSVPIFNLVSNPVLHSIFHEMVIYLLSHLLLWFSSWNLCFGSYLWQFQSAVLFCSQNVFILCWVTGGSAEFLERSALETKLTTVCPNPGCVSWAVSKDSPNSWFTMFSLGLTRWGSTQSDSEVFLLLLKLHMECRSWFPREKNGSKVLLKHWGSPGAVGVQKWFILYMPIMGCAALMHKCEEIGVYNWKP